jgi:ribonucleoside-triphosphate reductase
MITESPASSLSHADNGTSRSRNIFLLSDIRKRDGQVLPFDASKIGAAILKAGRATGEFGEEVARQLQTRVLSLAQMTFADEVPSVERIQDLVEDVLLTSPYKRTAKAYILYRDQHAHIRQLVEKADLDLVDQYLNELDWQVRENSNMSYSLQGLNNYISSEVSRIYWLNRLYSPEVRDAHLSGDFHIHDLGLLSVYCVGWDLHDLLLNGFGGAPGKAESAPAKHFRTALGQIVNFFYTLQGEAAGAQAFSNLDTLLAPFIRADKLSYKEVKQALQEFVFNLNVATRVGFQTPFTNVTLDLVPPAILADQPAIVGGSPIEATYGDFQTEMQMFASAFMEVLSEGDAKGRVFTFPIPTVNITQDFDWQSAALTPLWKATARYGIPYFANFVNSDLSPDDARSMCCRLRLDISELRHRGGGLFGASPLTGSIGVVTVNLPRIGYLADNEADFMDRLGRLMELARASLDTKRKALESFTDRGLYPYTRHYLRTVKERHGHFWNNHFSTIGIVGMNEACLNLKDCDIGSDEGRAFSLRVLDFMRERLTAFQEESGHQYNLEATPAEGTAFRLAKLDKKKFPAMAKTDEGVADEAPEPFYTNSTQLPVDYSNDPFEVLQLQDELQCRYTGGTVLHFFLGEAVPDVEAVKTFVRAVCAQHRLPYFSLTPTFSICPQHGYLPGEQHACERCGGATEVYSRVVGYLRPISQWNDGKQSEFHRRKMYSIGGRQA